MDTDKIIFNLYTRQIMPLYMVITKGPVFLLYDYSEYRGILSTSGISWFKYNYSHLVDGKKVCKSFIKVYRNLLPIQRFSIKVFVWGPYPGIGVLRSYSQFFVGDCFW